MLPSSCYILFSRRLTDRRLYRVNVKVHYQLTRFLVNTICTMKVRVYTYDYSHDLDKN